MARSLLIVDDSFSFRMLARLALERAGHVVLEAGNGEEALAQLERVGGVPLLCVISDVNMPRMDGVHFVERLKQHPIQKHVPVLMFSTESNLSKMARCKEMGVRAWLAKPFLPTTLVDAVGKLASPQPDKIMATTR